MFLWRSDENYPSIIIKYLLISSTVCSLINIFPICCLNSITCIAHNYPKDKQVSVSSVDPEQTAPSYGLHCLPFHWHLLDKLLYGKKLHCSNFRIIKTFIWGCPNNSDFYSKIPFSFSPALAVSFSVCSSSPSFSLSFFSSPLSSLGVASC